MTDFTVKDSGERAQFDSGMVRDVTEDKVDYTLALDGPMFKRYAVHLTKGAQKYDKRNWMKANGPDEFERFVESAARHFFQWLDGDTDEDHAAAVFFNINGAEYVKDRMDSGITHRERNLERYSHDSDKYENLAEEMLDEDSFNEPVNPESASPLAPPITGIATVMTRSGVTSDLTELEPGDVVKLSDTRIFFETSDDPMPYQENPFPEVVTLTRKAPFDDTWYVAEHDCYIIKDQIEGLVYGRATPANHGDMFQYDEAQVT